MIIDCIADLHGFYLKLEGGDLLIIAGDLTGRDTDQDHYDFIEWLGIMQKFDRKYKKVIYISGNHDGFLDPKNKRYGQIKVPLDWNIEYLCDSGTEFEGLKIWGSPWTKTFPEMNPHCKAFTCETEEELAEKWDKIPTDLDILITHGPPYGIFDTVRRYPQDIPESCGSKSLRNWIDTKWNPLQSLKINIFGHIHEQGNKTDSLNMIQFINCSYVNEHYQPVNKPIRVIL